MSTATLLSVEDFVQLGEANERFELVDGELVEKPVGNFIHDYGRDRTLIAIDLHLAQNPVGVVVSERDIRTSKGVRRPDISFFRFSQLTDKDLKKAVSQCPVLIIEVASPNDTSYELRAKVREYLESGTEIVFILYPENGDAENWQRGRAINPMGCSSIEADCLPGMSISIAPLFEMPVPPQNSEVEVKA